MTINATGNVSLGGSRTGESVNLEIAQSARSMISMNDTYSRILANKTTTKSSISFSDYRSRSFAIADSPGPVTNFIYNADYIVAKFKITDGYGLDTRTQIIAPSTSGYAGWGLATNISSYLSWGGDNNAFVPPSSITVNSGDVAVIPNVLYNRSDGRWGSFLNTYGVWPTTGTEVASYDIYRTFNAPYTGTYYIRTSADNGGNLYIDKDFIVTMAAYNTYSTTTVTLSAGAHTLKLRGVNGGDVAGIACTISDSTDTSILWDTRTYANATVIPATEYGYESSLFRVTNYKTAFPSATSVTIDYRAQWFYSAGSNPMTLELTGYKGGTMVAGNYTWTNPTATDSFVITSGGRNITMVSDYIGDLGQRLGVLTYNLTNGSGSIDVTT